MKYYAVKKGLKPGIYDNWEEAKQLVMGYPNAIYKAFNTLDAAKAYFYDEELLEKANCPIAYVDGSFNNETKCYSFGVVLIVDGKEYTFKKSFISDDMIAMRNVAGEIKGAAFIINYCYNRGIKKLIIYHDYIGISKWYLGQWKANKPGTLKYQAFSLEMKDKIDVTFIKVKAHSNNKYNDMADHLAKEALGIN